MNCVRVTLWLPDSVNLDDIEWDVEADHSLRAKADGAEPPETARRRKIEQSTPKPNKHRSRKPTVRQKDLATTLLPIKAGQAMRRSARRWVRWSAN